MASNREYLQKRRQERRKKFLMLLGGECVECGSKKDLQYDHISPEDKKYNVSRLIDSNEAKIMEELEKCQLLCWDCHKKKTRENGEHAYPPARHGTIWMYKDKKCRCDECKKAISDYYYSKKE